VPVKDLVERLQMALVPNDADRAAEDNEFSAATSGLAGTGRGCLFRIICASYLEIGHLRGKKKITYACVLSMWVSKQ
jgi:hypothetical protein